MLQRVRVIGQPWRGHEVDEEIELSRQDARFLAAYGRVEYVPPEVEFSPSPRLDEAVEKPAPKKRRRTSTRKK